MHLLNRGLLLGLLSFSALVGCGGGGSSSTPAANTLGGTAAVGFPIVGGTINVSCAGGSALASTTSSTGAWQVTLSGQTLPCAVQVSGGTINSVANATAYHSIAISAGTVNVTPLTDLLIANTTGVNPGTWFAGLNSSALASINQTAINGALTQLRTALALTQLNTANPSTQAFTAASGNAMDDMLTALHTAMTSTSVSYATLLSAAASSTFTPPTGLSAALTTAYANTTSGSIGSGSVNTGSGGAGCTGQVAALFALAQGSHTTAVGTFDNSPTAQPGATLPSLLGFTQGASTTVTVNTNCTVTVGSVTLAYTNGNYSESSVTGGTQYDVYISGSGSSVANFIDHTGVAEPHLERFTNGKIGLSFYDVANTYHGIRFDE